MGHLAYALHPSGCFHLLTAGGGRREGMKCAGRHIRPIIGRKKESLSERASEEKKTPASAQHRERKNAEEEGPHI